MSIELISLLTLAVAIGIGFKRNINTGLISIGFAVLLGFFVYMDISTDPNVSNMVALSSSEAKGNAFIAGFDSRLFFILLGVTLLFGIAKTNGCLEKIAICSTRLTRGHTKLIPVVFFFLAAILSAAGPGNIVMCAILLPMAMTISMNQKIPPVLMCSMVVFGTQVGSVSPLAPTGLINMQLSENIGLAGYETTISVFLDQIKIYGLYSLILYFILGGHKLKKSESVQIQETADRFHKQDFITIAVLLSVVLSVIIFGLNIGMMSFLGATILLILNVGDSTKAIASIPWGTLLLVVGVGMLVNVISIAGGIDLLTDFLSKFITPVTVAPIYSAISALMSFVSSASGVVMPTMIPTVPGMIESLESTIAPTTIISAIVMGAHMVSISPISTLGALGVASTYDAQEANKLFRQLLIISGCGILVAPIFAFIFLR